MLQDTDADYDVYLRRAGQTTLLTPGTPTLAEYTGSSSDATRVFFQTDDAATPGDTDAQLDGYSASVAVPAKTALPLISGPPAVGSTVGCSTGSWTGSPESFSYAWTRDGAAVTGATGPTYVVSPGPGTAATTG